MNAEIKTKWLEALRSGRYQQAESELKDDKGCFCCLGVLCEVVGAIWEDGETGREALVEGELINEPGGEILNNDFLGEIGMSNKDMVFLTRMNDGYTGVPHAQDEDDRQSIPKSRFAEIADYIEQNL